MRGKLNVKSTENFSQRRLAWVEIDEERGSYFLSNQISVSGGVGRGEVRQVVTN